MLTTLCLNTLQKLNSESQDSPYSLSKKGMKRLAEMKAA